MSMKFYRNVNSPVDFPSEHIVGLWHMPYTFTRHDGSQYTFTGAFSIHASLSQVKSTVTSTEDGRPLKRTYKVYELNAGQWVEIYEIPQGSLRTNHELWTDKKGRKVSAPKGKIGVSDDEVAEAIASIRRVT